jgi:diacylglycerol kinase family enzyme
VRAVLVSNPKSYRGPYPVERLAPMLRTAGWTLDVVERLPGTDVHDLLAPILANGTTDVVLSAGGDGTARDVAAEVAGSGLRLVILAGGTTNVVAREMGMPREPEAAARALLAATPRPLDLGRLTLPDGRVERFLLAAGLGLDAHVLAATDDALKRRVGPFAIAAAAIAAAPRLRPFAVRIDVDGARLHEGRVWQIVLPNARRWGGAFAIAPGAAADDGLLDVVALRDRGRFRLVVDLSELLILRHPHPSDVASGRGRSIRIDTDEPVALELDGTPIGAAESGPFAFAIEAGALQVLAPREL